MKDDLIIDLNSEKNLAKALSTLAESESPGRDLWPEIESKLAPRMVRHETKAYTPKWIPWAFAATLIVSFGSVYLSWNNLQNANNVVVKNHFNIESALNNDMQSQIESMSQEYGLAKTALLAQIGINTEHLDDDLLSDVKSNLIIIEQATSELKAAITKHPDNSGLAKLLKKTYQQELVVLSQLAKLDLES